MNIVGRLKNPSSIALIQDGPPEASEDMYGVRSDFRSRKPWPQDSIMEHVDAVLFFACFLLSSSFSETCAHDPDASNYPAWRRSRVNGYTVRVFPSIAESRLVVASMKIKNKSH